MCKPLEKYWRFNGVNTVLFLDDRWLIDSDRDACAVLATNIWSELKKSGFKLSSYSSLSLKYAERSYFTLLFQCDLL